MIEQISQHINLKGYSDFRLFSALGKSFKAIDNEEAIAATF